MKLVGPTVLLVILMRCAFAFNPNTIPKLPIEDTEQIAVGKWKILEKVLKNGVDDIIQQLLPEFIRLSEEVDISESCTSDLTKIVFDLRKLKLWAIKLIDAIGKPGAGMLLGTSSALGNYDECLDIVFPHSKQTELKPTTGQYCLLQVSIPLPPKPRIVRFLESPFKSKNSTFKTELLEYFKTLAFGLYFSGGRFGVCVPSTCSQTDLESLIEVGLKSYSVNGSVYSCETRKPFNMDNVQITIISIVAVLLVLVLLCSILDIYWPLAGRETPQSIGRDVISALSVNRSFRNTFAIHKSIDPMLDAVNGIRFLTVTLIILGHTLVSHDPATTRNLLASLDDIRKDFLAQAFVNAFFAIQTFYVIGGVLGSYNLVKAYDLYGSSVYNIPALAVRRMWRLLPSLMLLCGLGVLLPVLGSGPMYQDTMQNIADTCRDNWWYHALFINNFISLRGMCFPHTWFIATDFQLLLISMPYFYLLFKKPVYGKVCLVLMALASLISTSWVTYLLALPPSILMAIDFDTGIYYYDMLEVKVYPQLGAFALALGLGTFMARTEKVDLKKPLVIVAWLCAASLGMALVYGVLPWNSGQMYTPFQAVLYGSLKRPLWALCVCWIVFASGYGYAGFVGKLLSWGGFKPFVKISYLMYLFHLVIILHYNASQKGHVDVDRATLTYVFVATLGLTVLTCLGIRVLFEAPFVELDRIFTSRVFNDRKLMEKKSKNLPEQDTNLNK